MGEKQNQPFQLSFNASLKVDFQGSRVTSDGGLILVRELDERLGFGELIEQHLNDRRGTNTRLPLSDLLRQSVYSRLGWVRGHERCGAIVARSDLPADRFREDLGTRGGPDFSVADVRDGDAGRGGELRRAGAGSIGI